MKIRLFTCMTVVFLSIFPLVSRGQDVSASKAQQILPAILSLILEDDAADGNPDEPATPVPAPTQPTPSLPLPEESDSPPGSTAGVLSVSASGSATFALPFSLPPGAASASPKVGLAYDSDGGNGIAGMGWSLAGLSQITRCGRDIARDGVKAGVALTFEDRFCLDGQRLVMVAGSYYGAPDSEYRTEIDNYSKIIAVGTAGNGPSSFIVMLRDGSKLEYGNTADSKWIMPGHSTPRAWSINRFADARSNYYVVSYSTQQGSGQQLTSRIDYSGNDAQGIVPYNSVRFFYENNRLDVSTAYFLGQKITASSRLSTVRTFAKETMVREYRIGYDVSVPTGRSRLQSVTECADAVVCLPPTVFEWANDRPVAAVGEVVYGTPSQEFGPLLKGDAGYGSWADLNGDGKPDHCLKVSRDELGNDLICSLSKPDGGVSPVWVGNHNGDFQFIDVDGDGITDVCITLACLHANADKVSWHSVPVPGADLAMPQYSYHVDLNGDGLYDYCRMENYGTASDLVLRCAMRNTTGYGPLIEVGKVPAGMSYEWVDVSGDGIPSLCNLKDNAIRCQRWTAAGLAAPLSISGINLGEADRGRSWHDANGDGLADFCRPIANTPGLGGDSYIACTLSTGTGFGETITSPVFKMGTGYFEKNWFDVNGDGLLDFCRTPGSRIVGEGISCLLATTTGFAGEISFAQDHGQIADANGDGLQDYCFAEYGTAVRKCATARFGPAADLLISVTDGLGASKQITYKPLSDAAVYTKGTGATFPTSDVQNSSLVVHKIRHSDGVGGYQEETYSYEGLRVNLLGRGLLGFSSMKVHNSNGKVTKSEFMQDFPFTGLPKRIETMFSGVSTSVRTVSYHASVTAPYSILEVASITKNYDLNGAFINWVEVLSNADSYDAWGNVLQSNTVYKDVNGAPDGYSQTINSTYVNNVNEWIFGLKSRSTVTRRAPGQAESSRTQVATYYMSNPGFGLIREEIQEPDNGGLGVSNLRLVSSYAYDNFGNVLSKQVSGANTAARIQAAYTYDLQGRGPVSMTNALNQRERYEFDWRFGVVSSRTDSNGLVTTFSSDRFGRPMAETRPDGVRTSSVYKRCVGCVPNSAYIIERSQAVAATGAMVVPPSRTYFDMLSREIHRTTFGIDGAEIHAFITYNSMGQKEAASGNYKAGQAVNLTRYTYDAKGRATGMTLPDGGSFVYTFNGRSRIAVNPAGLNTSYRVDSQDQLVEKLEGTGSPELSSLAYTYDQWGNLIKTTDSFNNSIVSVYDLLGRKTRQTDPDLGTWTFDVNELGQVVTQMDAKSQKTIFSYDLLGRVVKVDEPDLSSQWYYDKKADGSSCGVSNGQLCETFAGNGYNRRLNYDELGRPSSQFTHIDEDYQTQWSYDFAGRLSSVTYPKVLSNAVRLNYVYSPTGWLTDVVDNASGRPYWTINSENADGSITSERYGNGLIGTRSYHPLSGRIANIKLGTSTSPGALMDQSYEFDTVGRLKSRQDDTPGVKTGETFGYDKLNRLTATSFVAPGVMPSILTVAYDAIGNIVSRSDIGTYEYADHGKTPHAVKKVIGLVNGINNPAYEYDGNGNLLTGAARSYVWTSFNMPASITKAAMAGSPGAGTSTFLYGSEHQRIKQVWSADGKTITTIYVDGGSFEKETDSSTGIVTLRNYISVAGRMVAVHLRNSGSGESVQYLGADHLGSTAVFTDATGGVLERQAHDPWGDNRVAAGARAGAADPLNTEQGSSVSRGYTGHEQLNRGNMGLVHMNGRIYDPTLGRFISPDPFVQAPDQTQSFNRYSYISNSPLNGVDPTGYVADEQVIVNGQSIGAIDAGEWSVLCRGSGCESFFASSQWMQTRISQLINFGVDQLVFTSKSGKTNVLDSKLVGYVAAKTAMATGKINGCDAYLQCVPVVGQKFEITRTQQAYLDKGDFVSFWRSRSEDSNDPVAKTALAGWAPYLVRKPSTFGKASAWFTWTTLRAFLSGNDAQKDAMMKGIGLALAKAHAAAVTADINGEIGVPGLLSPYQVAVYHWDVFKQYRVPSGVFGGTLMNFPAKSYAEMWCEGCDGN